MADRLSWLETWRGEFDIAEMMDPGRWERRRASVRHPATIFSDADIDRARENVRHRDWGRLALDRLMARVASAGPVTEAWAETYVPATTPYTPHFTMCPKCEFAPMHGAYDWSPDDPLHIRCKGCGTVYPNDEYPEDLVFQSRFDPAQRITIYGGKSWPAYGYAAIHSSFSGNARIRQCRHAANTAEDLALAYALTGDAAYAEAAATILRRFADVHPRYLVHSSYGDIADMDPKVAAPRVNDLPEDEWCPPGNVPDRKLYPGYWATLRWGSSGGMEGTSLQKVILAYDLIAGTLPDADRRHIEQDLLLDAAVLPFSDHVINNKTGMNRCAVGMIGLTCGDPLLVRFGLDGFVKAVRDWWLPDGGTSESIGYAEMMLSGVWRMAEALKRYEDPEGVDLPPARLSRVNLYDWPRYRAVWQGMARPLLPNLDYPLLADNRLPCHLSAMFSDLLARNYPSANHRRLQRDIAEIPRCYAGRIAQFWYGGNLDTSAAFYRDADEPPEGSPRFVDDIGPSLNIGTLRTGRDGRGSVVILSAADFKGHHHLDHLNLYYWKDGRELLTDLGYLWDMEAVAPKVRRTLAHQTVLVDGKDQKTKGRRGTFHLFSTGPGVKVMEASSDVYEDVPVYRRTVAVVGSGPSEYVVDLFRVKGGGAHDWVMHGPDRSLTLAGIAMKKASGGVYDLTETVEGASDRGWTATWRPGGGRAFRVHIPAAEGEAVFIGQGFGQRKAVDAGATVPYIVRRRHRGPSVFVTVYSEGKAVTSVRVAYLDRRSLTAVVEVVTPKGRDLVVSAGPGRPPWGMKVGRRNLDFDGRFGFVSGKRRLLIGGRYLSIGDAEVEIDRAAFSGPVLETYVTGQESGLVTAGHPADLGRVVGRHLFVSDGEGIVRTYPALGLVVSEGRPALITRRGNEGYDIRGGATWSAWNEGGCDGA